MSRKLSAIINVFLRFSDRLRGHKKQSISLKMDCELRNVRPTYSASSVAATNLAKIAAASALVAMFCGAKVPSA